MEERRGRQASLEGIKGPMTVPNLKLLHRVSYNMEFTVFLCINGQEERTSATRPRIPAAPSLQLSTTRPRSRFSCVKSPLTEPDSVNASFNLACV